VFGINLNKENIFGIIIVNLGHENLRESSIGGIAKSKISR
jgi:hypothetical protein